MIEKGARPRGTAMFRTCALAACVVVLSCGSDAPTAPDVPLPFDAPPLIPFPDSVVASNGLPPRVGSASAHVLAPDTIVYTGSFVAPVSAGRAMQVGVQVVVRDSSTLAYHLLPFAFADCPLVLRVYRAQSASPAPVWQSDRATGALRCPNLQTLDPSGTSFLAGWDVAAMLGDSLPAGRYSFGFALRTADGRTIEFTQPPAYLTADLTPPSTDASVIEWTAESRVEGIGPRMLHTVVTLRNPSTHTVVLNYGACNAVVRLYRTADRSGSPAWRSELRRYPGPPPIQYACPLPLYVNYLGPGDTLRFPLSFPMYEVMWDSLSAGRYYVSAVATVGGGDALNMGKAITRTLAADAVDLTRDPDHLPSSRVIDSMSYTATTRIVHGAGGADTIRTLVLVTNTSSTRRESDIAPDCPVIVYAYPSRALRDSLPLQKPSAYPDGGCTFNLHHFALDPGQSWVFGHDVPMAVARAKVPAGHYWFTAWLTVSPQVLLAAGDADVR